MPNVSLRSIKSSSECEDGFPAENLLLKDNLKSKPWKGKAGKDSNVVVFSLDKEVQLKSVDIGNEGSATIEVLVGKSCEPEAFSVLIAGTPLMSPIEGKNEKNMNRVKIFGQSQMITSTAANKWDLLKIVCKQPFNRQIPYGLAFIRIVGGEENEPIAPQFQENVLPTDQSNSFYDRLIEKMNDKEMSRMAASPTEDKEMWKNKRENMMEQARLNRVQKRKERRELEGWDSDDDLPYDEDETRPPSKKTSALISSLPNQPTSMLIDNRGRIVGQSSNNSTPTQIQTMRNLSTSNVRPSPNRNLTNTSQAAHLRDTPPRSLLTPKRDMMTKTTNNSVIDLNDSDEVIDQSSITREEIPTSTPQQRASASTSSPVRKRTPTRTSTREENDAVSVSRDNHRRPRATGPLVGVNFALSGFENPTRSQIRDKAISLGAACFNDLHPSLTHLVCAFKNTPKAKMAGPNVSIVSSFWVDRCHLEKRRLNEALFSFP